MNNRQTGQIVETFQASDLPLKIRMGNTWILDRQNHVIKRNWRRNVLLCRTPEKYQRAFKNEPGVDSTTEYNSLLIGEPL